MTDKMMDHAMENICQFDNIMFSDANLGKSKSEVCFFCYSTPLPILNHPIPHTQISTKWVWLRTL